MCVSIYGNICRTFTLGSSICNWTGTCKHGNNLHHEKDPKNKLENNKIDERELPAQECGLAAWERGLAAWE